VGRIYRKRLWAEIGKKDSWSVSSGWFIWLLLLGTLGDWITDFGFGLESVKKILDLFRLFGLSSLFGYFRLENWESGLPKTALG